MTSIIEDEMTNSNSEISEHGETLKALTSDENYERKIILTSYEQAYAYGTLWIIAEENSISIIKKWLKQVGLYNVSVLGKNLENIVEVSKYSKGGNIPFAEKLFDRFSKR